MGFKDAVSAVPAKPIIAVAIGVTILGALWRGWAIYDFCDQRAAMTSKLQTWADGVIAGVGKDFELADVTGFDWDEVRISQGVTDIGTGQNCPFGWHWNNEKRTAMAKAGDLTLIGFFNEGRFVGMADFDRSWAIFDTDGSAISRKDAVFVNVQGTDTLRRAGTSAAQ